MNSLPNKLSYVVAAVCIAAIAFPALAAITSTPTKANASARISASNANQVAKAKTAIDNRIKTLTAMSNRISQMRKISDSQKNCPEEWHPDGN